MSSSSMRQKATDEDIFRAAQRAMVRRGPHELTLADIAGEAGVTPGLLVQRFGGKRELLLALSARFAQSARPFFASLRAEHSQPLTALFAYADCIAGLADTPDSLARNLAWLQTDLTDEEFRVNLLANAKATRRQLAMLVQAAIDAGELSSGAKALRLARTIETVVQGSLMTWACYREGSAAAWVRQDLEEALRPYLGRRGKNGPRAEPIRGGGRKDRARAKRGTARSS